ncbi:MAG: zf-HC2 domain-containing protein [Spongiibacteraceae bacterium]
MINCQQVTRLFSDAQERPLSLKERTSLKVHIMMCSGCRNFGKQMNILRQLTHEYVKGTQGAHSNEDIADTDNNSQD